MSKYFLMANGERIEGDVYRENDEHVEVRMMNGSEAILPKAEILEQGRLDERPNDRR